MNWKEDWDSVVEQWEKDIKKIKKNLTKTNEYVKRQLDIRKFLQS